MERLFLTVPPASMNFFLLTTDPSGVQSRREIGAGDRVVIEGGEEIIVVDENGRPVAVEMRPSGEDLVITLEEDQEVVFTNFFASPESGAPASLVARHDGVAPGDR